MVNITKKILFETQKKPGRKSIEQQSIDANVIKLEIDIYNKYLDDKHKASVFYLATVQTNPFKNLFTFLSDAFEHVVLEITPKCISLVNWRYKSKLNKKYDIIFSLLCFQETHNMMLIYSDRCEIYECCVDKIMLNLNSSELSIISKYITNESVVRLFIDKTNYNTENNEALSIEFNITDQSDTSLIYNSLTFTCEKYVEIKDNENIIDS
jgi:hypothetical protein